MLIDFQTQTYIVALVAMAIMTFPVTPEQAAECPAACQCKLQPKVKVYCNGTGRTSDSLLHTMQSVPRATVLLNLSSNDIHILATNMFTGLPDLEYLILSNNSMTTLGLGVFGFMPKLKELDLRRNNFKYIPRNIFVSLPQLEKLFLGWNKIKTIQGDAFDLPALKFLCLKRNRLTVLGPLWLSGMPSLEYLDLSQNDISVVDSGSLQGMTFLDTLMLSYNRLLSLPDNVFQDLTSLKQLYLDGNMLTALNFIQPATSFNTLQVLNLDDNCLNSVPRDAFLELKKLKTLSLEFNNISSLEPMSFRGLYLDSLSLAHNSLDTVKFSMFSGVGRITVLDLADNKISVIEGGAFSTLASSLHTLDLSMNRIGTIHRAMFHALRVLEKLNLSYNGLWSILGMTFETLENLKDLDLDHNSLEWMSANLLEEAPLQRLSILHNPLTAVLDDFQLDKTKGPLSIYVNLSFETTSTSSVTVQWPFRGGKHRSWHLQVWCVSENCACAPSCDQSVQEARFLPQGGGETISGLQAGSQFYVCVAPVYPHGVEISQCGLVRTKEHIYGTHFTNRGASLLQNLHLHLYTAVVACFFLELDGLIFKMCLPYRFNKT